MRPWSSKSWLRRSPAASGKSRPACVGIGSVVATLVVAPARIVVLALVVVVLALGLLDLVFVPFLDLVVLFLGVGRIGLLAMLRLRLVLSSIVGGFGDFVLAIGSQLHVGGKDGGLVVVARGSDSYSGPCGERRSGDKQRDQHEFRLQ